MAATVSIHKSTSSLESYREDKLFLRSWRHLLLSSCYFQDPWFDMIRGYTHEGHSQTSWCQLQVQQSARNNSVVRPKIYGMQQDETESVYIRMTYFGQWCKRKKANATYWDISVFWTDSQYPDNLIHFSFGQRLKLVINCILDHFASWPFFGLFIAFFSSCLKAGPHMTYLTIFSNFFHAQDLIESLKIKGCEKYIFVP